MKGHLAFLTAAIVFIWLAHAAAQDPVRSINLPQVRTELKAGPGKDRAEVLCGVCHSVDYITMQPNFPRSQWTATVNKMIKTFGAPVSEADAKTIIDYLSSAYGTGK